MILVHHNGTKSCKNVMRRKIGHNFVQQILSDVWYMKEMIPTCIENENPLQMVDMKFLCTFFINESQFCMFNAINVDPYTFISIFHISERRSSGHFVQFTPCKLFSLLTHHFNTSFSTFILIERPLKYFRNTP